MADNESKSNSNSSNEQQITKTPAEKVQSNLKNSGNDELLKMARRQKAEFDQERAEWEVKERQRAKDEMELLRENTHTKKELSDLRKEIESLKYKSVLDREMELASEQEKNTGEPVPLTREQKVQEIFQRVIQKRKEKALKAKEKKTDNVYFM